VRPGGFLERWRIVAMDTPRSLKLQHGERSVHGGVWDERQVESANLFFLDQPGRSPRFPSWCRQREVQTIHSQEATLEQIFIKLTGRG
jgi:fluoroquinolone transport system ATP-binding protein